MTFAQMLQMAVIVTGLTGTFIGLVVWVFQDKISRWVFRTFEVQNAEFQRHVLNALMAQPGEFRRWNDSLYVEWREDQVKTDQVAQETHRLVTRLIVDFSEWRSETRESAKASHDFTQKMSRLPDALDHLAVAVDKLSRVQTQLELDLRGVQQQVAIMRATSHPTT
jgi:hypothetical protein